MARTATSRRLLVAGVVLWSSIAFVGVAWGGMIVVSDSMYCEHPDRESYYGELSWSVLPPGPVCTWPANGTETAETRGPTPVMSIWLAVLAALGILLLRARAGGRRSA